MVGRDRRGTPVCNYFLQTKNVLRRWEWSSQWENPSGLAEAET